MKRRVYCLAVRESLSPVGSLESFRATLTKNLTNDCCFWENRLNCEYVKLSRQTSSTRIAKNRSFIKLKFLQNFYSSCKTLPKVLLYLNPKIIEVNTAHALRHIFSMFEPFISRNGIVFSLKSYYTFINSKIYPSITAIFVEDWSC
jgi:hypothetical protein